MFNEKSEREFLKILKSMRMKLQYIKSYLVCLNQCLEKNPQHSISIPENQKSSKNSDLNFNLREVKKDIKPKPSMTRRKKRLKTKKGKKN